MRLLTLTAAVLVVLAVGTTVTAQDEADLDRKLAYINAEKEMLLGGTLKLTDVEAAAFWPVYREYAYEVKTEFQDTMKALIEWYTGSFLTITDDDAGEMAEEWLELRERRLSLKWKYLRRFDKILPTRKVVMVFQVEHQLNLMNELDLVSELPFITGE